MAAARFHQVRGNSACGRAFRNFSFVAIFHAFDGSYRGASGSRFGGALLRSGAALDGPFAERPGGTHAVVAGNAGDFGHDRKGAEGQLFW